MSEDNVISLNDLMLTTSDKSAEEIITYNKNNGWPDLSPAQRLFGFHFMITRSPRKAAEEAGISPKRGSALLRHPLVSAFIDYLQTQQAVRFNIDADFALMEMLEAMEMFKGEVPVNMIDSDGMQFSGKQFQGPQYLALLKEFNKIAGVYKDTNKGAGAVTVNLDFGALGLSPEEASRVTIEGTTLDEDEIPL